MVDVRSYGPGVMHDDDDAPTAPTTLRLSPEQLRALAALVVAELAALEPPEPPVEWTDDDGIARRYGVVRRTAQNWRLRDGMPYIHAGRVVRIHVATADAWLRDRGRAPEARAAADAAREHARRAARTAREGEP